MSCKKILYARKQVPSLRVLSTYFCTKFEFSDYGKQK